MGSMVETYIKETSKIYTGYCPLWIPNTLVKIGDIGILEKNNIFHKVCSLEDLLGKEKSDLLLKINKSTKASISYNSNTKILFQTKSSASNVIQTIPLGKAGVKIDFLNKNSFLIRCKEVQMLNIDNIIELEKSILDIFNTKWNPNWYIVLGGIEMNNPIIMIAKGANTGLTLQADMDFSEFIVEINNQSELNIVEEKGEILSYSSNGKIMPFIKLGSFTCNLNNSSSNSVISIPKWLKFLAKQRKTHGINYRGSSDGLTVSLRDVEFDEMSDSEYTNIFDNKSLSIREINYTQEIDESEFQSISRIIEKDNSSCNIPSKYYLQYQAEFTEEYMRRSKEHGFILPKGSILVKETINNGETTNKIQNLIKKTNKKEIS